MTGGGTPPPDDPHLERGLHNPDVIDLISRTGDDLVDLLMLQRRPWPDDEAQLVEQLQSKFNAYFDYVLKGYLGREYPQYHGHRVRVVLEWREAPPVAARQVLTQATQIAADRGLGVEDRPLSEAGARAAPWERGEGDA